MWRRALPPSQHTHFCVWLWPAWVVRTGQDPVGISFGRPDLPHLARRQGVATPGATAGATEIVGMSVATEKSMRLERWQLCKP